MLGDTAHALLLHKPQPFQQPCDARHIVGPGLQPVRQLLRHLLQDRLRPRAARSSGSGSAPHSSSPRALRPVQSFMPPAWR